ncbi:protein-disulfide reductase DsbD [Halopseudomonas xiamenensis]
MSVYRPVLMLLVLALWSGNGLGAGNAFLPWSNDQGFLEAGEVFQLEPPQAAGDGWVAQGRIAEDYYVYRHSLRLEDAQGRAVELDMPEGVARHDEFFGDTEIFMGDSLQLRFAAATAPLTLHWQGCAEAGLCYPPQSLAVSLPGSSPVAAGGDRGSSAPQTGSATLAEDQAAAQRLATLGPLAGTALFFGFGLLLAFTPCTLPMIPIVSSMVVGSQARPRRAFALTLSYVLTMAGTYALLGVAAGLAGANLQATLQSPWLLGAFAALFVILASSLFGLFELRLPSVLVNRVEAAGRGQAGGSLAGAAALGLLSALLVGPCMTAPLAGALLYIGQTGSALYGGLALFALGLGMGLPLLVIAVFGARVLPKPGAWMDRVRVAFGYVMLGMAVLMLARFLPGNISLLLWGAWALAVAVGLVAWAQALVARQRLAWGLRFGAVLVGLWSLLMLVGAASGGDSTLQPLAHLRGAAPAAAAAQPEYVQAKSVAEVDARLADAAEQGQWTLIDFYADWCISCHVIEREVFGDPAVAARLARMQVVRPDVTRNDAADRELLRHWGVLGPPTLILVSPDGEEHRALRVVGEIPANDFLARLDTAGTP